MKANEPLVQFLKAIAKRKQVTPAQIAPVVRHVFRTEVRISVLRIQETFFDRVNLPVVALREASARRRTTLPP
jgi:hypothetical protein